MMEIFKNFKILKEDPTKSIERDVGMVQDLYNFLKDCVAFEDHSLNQFLETGDLGDLKDMAWMRKLRTHYLSIASSGEGNRWCQGKHLLRIAMGLQEACTRFLSIGDIENAKKCAEHYGEVYLKFLKINGYTLDDLNKSKTSA